MQQSTDMHRTRKLIEGLLSLFRNYKLVILNCDEFVEIMIKDERNSVQT